MLQLRIITVGGLKEKDFSDACDEYIKRLGAFAKTDVTGLKEARLPDSPSQSEINAALSDEAGRILEKIPDKAYVVVCAVEGKEMSSPALASKLEAAMQTHPAVCFVIGSSFGLDPRVKQRADLLLSFSQMTFPHRLFRVMLLEQIYRSFSIIKGTGYHK